MYNDLNSKLCSLIKKNNFKFISRLHKISFNLLIDDSRVELTLILSDFFIKEFLIIFPSISYGIIRHLKIKINLILH